MRTRAYTVEVVAPDDLTDEQVIEVLKAVVGQGIDAVPDEWPEECTIGNFEVFDP